MSGDDAPVTDVKRMRLRFAGTCSRCGTALGAGVQAFYDQTAKTVHCLECPAGEESPRVEAPSLPEPQFGPDLPPVQIGPEPMPPGQPELGVSDGVPGGGARREYERRHANREARVRANHPRIGGVLLALTDDPQSTNAWAGGALGEEGLGRTLTELAGPSLRVLHDRRIPSSRANIDHIAVCPTGVYVIDAKRYVDQRPRTRSEGGILRPRVDHLYVGGRCRDDLVTGVLKQTGLVRAALADDAIPVRGVLCFIEADFPLLGGSFTIQEVDVVWPRKLYQTLGVPGPLDTDTAARLHRRLAAAFPRA